MPRETARPKAQVAAGERLRALVGLLLHAAAFAAVNTLLWVQDIAAGGGVDYAYWTTIPWGIGLTFHALAYVIGLKFGK